MSTHPDRPEAHLEVVVPARLAQNDQLRRRIHRELVGTFGIATDVTFAVGPEDQIAVCDPRSPDRRPQAKAANMVMDIIMEMGLETR